MTHTFCYHFQSLETENILEEVSLALLRFEPLELSGVRPLTRVMEAQRNAPDYSYRRTSSIARSNDIMYRRNIAISSFFFFSVNQLRVRKHARLISKGK